MRAPELVAFILAREAVRVNKERGLAKPWTPDPILQAYRFCNVQREHDTETKWIADNWRAPRSDDPDLWFAMVMARLFNWHETLDELGYPFAFNAAYIKQMRRTLAKRISKGQKVWTGAYMVSTNGKPVDFKHDYVIECVLRPAWRDRADVRPVEGDTLESFYHRLMQCEGMGTFMAGQVIADVKYAEGSPLFHANDWETWATPGPGSKRGLNRVLGRELRETWRKGEFLPTLQELRKMVGPLLREGGFQRTLHAQDLQNCLCEFDKYERVRLGEGRPRARYNGAGDVT